MAGTPVDELHRAIRDGTAVADDPFGVVRAVGSAYALAEADADGPSDPELLRARELVIRLVDHRASLGDVRPLHDTLLARLGLYPYLEAQELSGPDLLAFEAHRPLGALGDEMVWHRQQARAYALLMDGTSVILSAPTSFGKSRVIDGLVASGTFRNLLIVVPTIALIDEARRRLTRLAGDDYKVVTHGSQTPGEKTIYVLTQERVLEFETLPELDLFVIDEFYKLALDDDVDRARLLNQALYRLLQAGTQFYLLGPNIGGIAQGTLDQLDCVWIDSWDTTVAVDVIPAKKGRKMDRLVDVCRECVERGEQTLIYCSGPGKAERIGLALAEAGLGRPQGEARDAAAWLGDHFHPEWRVTKAMGAGIGVHHGQLPRAIGHYMVSAFDNGAINFLACTSTLIEGVNTKAKNVVVFDHTIGQRRPIDLFTFHNIRGRSGRMLSHVTGRVYLFRAAPDPPLQEIDFPILSQPDDAPPELFIGMEDEDLRTGARNRLREALEDAPVSAAVLEASPAVSIEDQLKLASAIERLPAPQAALLSWSGPYPNSEQVEAVFDLVWNEILVDKRARPFGAGSPRQLVVWLSLLESGTTRDLIANQVEFSGAERLDDTILSVLRFQRTGLAFQAPKWLMTIERIQRELLPRRGMSPGDYSAYASRLENSFLRHPLGALDEYGIPVELARKLTDHLAREGDDLDDALERLRRLNLNRLDLSAFERRLLADARTDLGGATRVTTPGSS